MQTASVLLAGCPVRLSFRFSETAYYFRKWRYDAVSSADDGAVCIPDEAFSEWESFGNRSDAFAEFRLFSEQISEYLLGYDRCVFHAAAFAFRGKAYLIAAGSGVGKTTRLRKMLELYPAETAVINGDKPILEYRPDATIMVHPSPWTGKEGLHGAPAAPLSGIFLLRRGEADRIEAVSAGKAVSSVYRMIFQTYMKEDVMRLAGAFTEKLLLHCPVWILTAKDVSPSTQLMADTILKEVSADVL